MEIKARLIPYRGGLSVVVIERHHYHPLRRNQVPRDTDAD